jgi:3D (Asp-Asp-Asp) domain-containing protein
MKAIENFAFGIAFGLAVGLSYGMQHPMTTTPAPVTTTPVPTKTAAVESDKKECEPQPVLTVPKFLGPYKRGNTGVMHALLSFYEHGPGSINDDQILANGKTSIGRKPVVGRTIAVDPKVIPYGSRVFIPGFGWRVAEDTGAQIKGNRIDVLVENEEKAYNLGRKSALVLWTR